MSGFKLLDAYVEVTASGKGLAEKVGRDFESESPAAARRSSASFGSSLLSSFRALPSVGGSVAKKVGDDFEKEAPEAGRRSSSSFGSSLLGGMKGLGSVGSAGASLFGSAFTGVIGGLVGGVTSTVLGMVGSVVSGATQMAAQLVSITASTVIDFNSTLQNATIGFTTMLGSGEKSAAFLNKLQDFAKTTPFEFKNLISNAQNMMGMGIAAKDVIPTLTALGDSVASIGGNAAQVDQVTLAFDQMAAKGTLDMGNMNQLMQGGVPSALKILAAAYKTTTGDMIGMISTGKVQADVALPALVRGLEKGTKSTAALGGMMAKQSTTFTGALSNIVDGLTQTTSKAFKPFFDTASKGMQRFATALSGKPAEKFQKDVTKALQPFAAEINKWFKTVDIGKIFTSAGKAITGMLKGVKPKEVMGDLQGAMKGAADVAGSFVKVMPQIGKGLKEAGPYIVEAGKQVAGFIGWLGDAIKWFHDTDKAITDWWHATDKATTGFMVAIGGALASAVTAFNKWVNDVRKSVGDFFKVVGQIPGKVKGFFDGANKWLMDAGANIIAGLVGGIQSRIADVTNAIGHVADVVKGAFTGALKIQSPSKVFEQYGTWVVQGLHKGLLGSVDQIKSASGALAEAVKSKFKGQQEADMLAAIKKTTSALVSEAKKRDKAVDNLAAARSKLADLKSAKADYAAGIKSSVIGSGAIGSIFATAKDAAAAGITTTSSSAAMGSLDGSAYQPSWSTTTTSSKPVLTGVAAIKAGLKKLLANTKAFTTNLKKLVKMGLDKTSLQQLIDVGPTDGLEITKDLLADPAGMRSIVDLQKQLGTAAGALGSYAGGQMYDKQISAAQKTVSHDKAVVNHYEVTMVVEAKKIDEVDKLIKTVAAMKQAARTKSKAKR